MTKTSEPLPPGAIPLTETASLSTGPKKATGLNRAKTKLGGKKPHFEDTVDLWPLFIGDSTVGINKMLQFYSRQRAIREIQRQPHVLFDQTKRMSVTIGGKLANVVCTSQAYMDVLCEDRLSRQMLYHEACNCNLAVVMFDIKKKATFLNAIRTYVPELQANIPSLTIVMLGLGLEARESNSSCVSYQEASYFVECCGLDGYFEAHSLESSRPYYLVDSMIERSLALAMQNCMPGAKTAGSPKVNGKGQPSDGSLSPTSIKGSKSTKKKEKRKRKTFGSLRKRLDLDKDGSK